jgi:hypothetical protein
MTTKKELQAQLEAAGISLPAGWSKMSLPRAREWATAELKSNPNKRLVGRLARSAVSAIGAAAHALGGAMARAAEATSDLADAFAATPPAYASAPRAKAATMPKDPNWKRGGSQPGKYEFYPSYPGPDPEPMTRQVRRQNERRASKMPIGARQSAWHALNGFGRIGSGV